MIWRLFRVWQIELSMLPGEKCTVQADQIYEFNGHNRVSKVMHHFLGEVDYISTWPIWYGG